MSAYPHSNCGREHLKKKLDWERSRAELAKRVLGLRYYGITKTDVMSLSDAFERTIVDGCIPEQPGTPAAS